MGHLLSNLAALVALGVFPLAALHLNRKEPRP